MRMVSWLDLRSVAQADRLLKSDLPPLLYRNTGNIPTAKDVIPKILWLRDERPDLWRRTARLLDCKEYILFRLTGTFATDHHGASSYFLLDLHTRQWSEAACQALGIPLEMLPPAFPCTAIIGEVTDQAARETGLKAGTPVVACAGDVAWPNPALEPALQERRICASARPPGSGSQPAASPTTPCGPSGHSAISTPTSGSLPARWRPAAGR